MVLCGYGGYCKVPLRRPPLWTPPFSILHWGAVVGRINGSAIVSTKKAPQLHPVIAHALAVQTLRAVGVACKDTRAGL